MELSAPASRRSRSLSKELREDFLKKNREKEFLVFFEGERFKIAYDSKRNKNNSIVSFKDCIKD